MSLINHSKTTKTTTTAAATATTTTKKKCVFVGVTFYCSEVRAVLKDQERCGSRRKNMFRFFPAVSKEAKHFFGGSFCGKGLRMDMFLGA